MTLAFWLFYFRVSLFCLFCSISLSLMIDYRDRVYGALSQLTIYKPVSCPSSVWSPGCLNWVTTSLSICLSLPDMVVFEFNTSDGNIIHGIIYKPVIFIFDFFFVCSP